MTTTRTNGSDVNDPIERALDGGNGARDAAAQPAGSVPPAGSGPAAGAAPIAVAVPVAEGGQAAAEAPAAPAGAPADVLATIVAATRRTIEVRRTQRPWAVLEADARVARPDGAAFAAALSRAGSPDIPFNVIAECKRRSPSKGVLRAAYDPVTIASAYASAGAAAISVLTEPSFFDGALDHLSAVRRVVQRPLLRKDFIVDEYQILEALAAGADAILLIVAALDDRTLRHLLREAEGYGLAALVETHTREELQRALAAGARIVGVNSRSLRTLQVSLDTAIALGAELGSSTIGVAESGIRSRQDLETLRAAGYSAFLVGERLMTEADPGAALRRLVTADAASAGSTASAAAGDPAAREHAGEGAAR